MKVLVLTKDFGDQKAGDIMGKVDETVYPPTEDFVVADVPEGITFRTMRAKKQGQNWIIEEDPAKKEKDKENKKKGVKGQIFSLLLRTDWTQFQSSIDNGLITAPQQTQWGNWRVSLRSLVIDPRNPENTIIPDAPSDPEMPGINDME